MFKELFVFFGTQIVKALIEKNGGKGQNHLAVHIVLDLIGRVVIGTNGSAVSITLPVSMLDLGDWNAAIDSVNRPKSVVEMNDSQKELQSVTTKEVFLS